MGRLAQGHYDDVFLNKIKEVCIHVLEQLNDANEIDQAFDLCPSISRRNRVILSFLRDADQVNATADAQHHSGVGSSSASPSLASLRPSTSIRPSREPSLGTDSVASLSAQRRRRAREMQYVRDPNDSNDDSDSQATIGPSTSARHHLDPASARDPTMSQPDYTFEQFADHLDPTNKFLKRSFEIIIKETARQALAKKRDPQYNRATVPSGTSQEQAAPLRSDNATRLDHMFASSRARPGAGPSRRMFEPFSSNSDRRDSDSRSSTLDLLRSLSILNRTTDGQPSTRDQPVSSSSTTERPARRYLRDFLLTSTEGLLDSTHYQPTALRESSSFASRSTRHPPYGGHANDRTTNAAGSSTQRRPVPRASATMGITPQIISERLAEASRRNAEAARTIGEAERLRSSQFIRTSIESLRASLFQLHIDLACAQLQQAPQDGTQQSSGASPSSTPDIGASYALVMDTIELFDDTLRRLSCLVSNTSRDDERNPVSTTQAPSAQRNPDASQMRTSLWRARNLLLLSSMTRRPHSSEASQPANEASTAADGALEAELRAHRHLLASMEEAHWCSPDVEAPSSDSIRAWRRKLAAWYHLDRDRSQYPDAPSPASDREENYIRWHPDLELPYAPDDEILAPMAADATSSRPDPIANTHEAWSYARTHDASLPDDLNQDAEVRATLEAASVTSALQNLLRLRSEGQVPAATAPSSTDAEIDNASASQTAVATAEDADPDVSLTRSTSLSRRNAVRGLPLNNSDASSIRSARSSLSLRRARDSNAAAQSTLRDGQDDTDAIDEEVVETSMEIGTVPHSPEATASQQPVVGVDEASLLPPSERPQSGRRSSSFTFISTPAAVLRSRQRSQSRSQGGRRSQSPAPAALLEDDHEEALEDDDSEAEEFIDLDLGLGMAGAGSFEFDLVDYLRSGTRRDPLRRRSSDDDDDAGSDFVDASPRRIRRLIREQALARLDGESDGSQDEAGEQDTSPRGPRVVVSGSGASTPAYVRQATFEAYAERARVLERRHRLERQRREHSGEADADAATEQTQISGGNGSQEASPESRRRRRGRNIGNEVQTQDEETDRRNSLPFPRTSER